MDEPVYWSDQLANAIKNKFPDRDEYVCAAGISPSGKVHAGNFREIITVDFVVKSLRDMGEDARFIYSWDDYDRFRKVPSNVPEEWEEYLGLPLTSVPDPDGCHSSYADHFESKLEEELEDMHMDIDFIYQTDRFRNSEYADLIKKAMKNREKIKEILDKYREQPLERPYHPLRVYCKECGKDFTEVEEYEEPYTVKYYCEECDEVYKVNFSENDSVKPPWRVDWPLRWFYEDVSYEPAGKEHSAAGGSRDTANELIRTIFDQEPPVHQMYEFVTKEGSKISSSSGEDAFTLTDLKQIYSPEMIRFLFSETKPNKAFEIPFGEDVIDRYERFDEIENAYFNPEELSNERKKKHWKRVYELAMVNVPDQEPVRIPFKHASFVAQTVPKEEWEEKAIKSLKRTGHLPKEVNDRIIKQVTQRMEKARNWARQYAPEEYQYEINFDIPDKLSDDLSKKQREAMLLLADLLEQNDFENQDKLDSKIFDVKNESELGTGEFFKTAYQILLSREQGPRLSRLILSIGVDESSKILNQVQ